MNFFPANLSNSSIPGLKLGGNRGEVDLASLWAIISSISTFRDWAKVFVVGGVLETGRRYIWRIWAYFISFFFMEAQLDASEPSYREC